MNSAVKAWESSKVNIAVIVETYVGKSTHIDLHFGNNATTAGHAGDTTQTVTPYGQTGPINEESDRKEVLVFWDLPGFNTKNSNRETYDGVAKLDRYHFFLILTDKIFTHDIQCLLGEILRRNKRFFLVRKKIDHGNVLSQRRGVSQYIREAYGHTERKVHPQIAWKLKESVSKL